MEPENSNPKVLLLHDRELDEIGFLLRELGVHFVERLGQPTDFDQRVDWTLIITSQQRASAFDGNPKVENARRITVIENDSRTLRSMLRRLGIDYVVARPVHATALRLLVLHCLYTGPERRNQTRVSVGAKIQYRSGFFRRDCILADLSLRGCRLVSEKPIKAGTKLKLLVAANLSGGRPFQLPGRALRTDNTSHRCDLGQSTAVAFYGLSAGQGQHLRKLVNAHLNGPAKLLGTTSDLLVGGGLAGSPKGPQEAQAGAESERRSGPRKDYSRRVVTLNDEATRVLLCRDISLGGMRVEPNDTLVAGDDLLVAIHTKSRSEPLVVNALVKRDDGPEGLVLEFHDLSNDSAGYLRELVEQLPSPRNGDGDGTLSEADLFVSEIVERRAS